MEGHRSQTASFGDIDAALDAIQESRERALCELSGRRLLLRLAALADAEAGCWEELGERTGVRVHWRTALVARASARGVAAQCRRAAAAALEIGLVGSVPVGRWTPGRVADLASAGATR